VLLQHRVAVYEAARKWQPQRWSGKIRNWTLPDVVWLNPEREIDSGQKRKAA
jgi:putative transposase